MSEFNVGDKVAIYTANHWGIPRVTPTVIEKETKTQYVLTNGARYRKDDCREVGVDRYRSSLLIALDDPRIAEAQKQRQRQALVNSLSSAYDKWYRDRRVSPIELVATARNLADWDAAEKSSG